MPKWFWGFLLLLPALLLVLGVIAAPIAYLVRLGFTDAHAYLPRLNFVGLDNYLDLAGSPQFWESVRLTAWYALLTVGLQIVLGVVVALILHQDFRGRGLIRVVALAPYMIPAIIVALVWRWLLDEKSGAYTWIASTLLPGDGRPGFLGPNTIFWSLAIVSIWMFTPFIVISVLARLQTIDNATLEAARVDGAGPWRTFWSIVLPELMPVLLTLMLLRFMFMFTKFDIVYLFAGTGQEVRTLPILTFQRIFGESRLGAGAALAMVLYILLMIFTTVYLRLLFRREREAS